MMLVFLKCAGGFRARMVCSRRARVALVGDSLRVTGTMMLWKCKGRGHEPGAG